MGGEDLAMLQTIECRWSDFVCNFLQSLKGKDDARKRLRCAQAEGSVIRVCPHQVSFINASIAERFSCGRTLANTIAMLRDGSLLPEEIPRITVIRRGDRLLTLNHRRLYAFQQALERDAQI